MFMIFAAVLAQANASVPAPAAPPPLVVRAANAPSSGETREYRVEILAEGTSLWSGTLRVAPGQAASFNMGKTESAARSGCPAPPRYESNRSNLQLSLNSLGERNEQVRVRLSWQRPIDTPDCASIGSSRTVALDGTADFAIRRTNDLEGDAGLHVRLTRR